VYPHGIFVSSDGNIGLAYPQKKNEDGDDDDEDDSADLAGGFESERCGFPNFLFLFLFFC
jgi:hypothetical protein